MRERDDELCVLDINLIQFLWIKSLIFGLVFLTSRLPCVCELLLPDLKVHVML
jgi:hypothetical protein